MLKKIHFVTIKPGIFEVAFQRKFQIHHKMSRDFKCEGCPKKTASGLDSGGLASLLYS